MNKVVLIGRITKDPEVRYTQSGAAVSSFVLAVNRDYKDNAGNTPTDFISCVAWEQQAEFIANYIKKGYLIAVSGSIQVRSFQNQQGQDRVITEVIIDRVKNLTPKEQVKEPQTRPNPNSKAKLNGQPVDFVPNDNDLPF